jgi:hypothetical protein
LAFCAFVVLFDGLVGYCQQGHCLVFSASVGHNTADVIILEVTEFVSLDVILKFPLEIAYSLCLVLHSLELLYAGKLGHTVIQCRPVFVRESCTGAG